MGQDEAQVPLLGLEGASPSRASQKTASSVSPLGGLCFSCRVTCREIGLLLSVLLKVDSTAFPHWSNPEDGWGGTANKQSES